MNKDLGKSGWMYFSVILVEKLMKATKTYIELSLLDEIFYWFLYYLTTFFHLHFLHIID